MGPTTLLQGYYSPNSLIVLCFQLHIAFSIFLFYRMTIKNLELIQLKQDCCPLHFPMGTERNNTDKETKDEDKQKHSLKINIWNKDILQYV